MTVPDTPSELRARPLFWKKSLILGDVNASHGGWTVAKRGAALRLTAEGGQSRIPGQNGVQGP